MELGTKETREQIKLNDKKFSEILDELRNLELYHITGKLTDVYYNNSTIQFNHGLETGDKIFNNIKKY